MSLERLAPIAKFVWNVDRRRSDKDITGYFRNNQFWKFRELSAVWHTSECGVANSSAAGIVARLRARNLHTWTVHRHRSRGELRSDAVEGQNEFQTAGLPTYFTFRLNLKY